ncbi:MAG: exodeoxyribonuclease III [Methylobacteriaceae bacterium]|nr:exodeoxyribonuclease III [Methylobacteriaceae bacterium]
MKIATFNINDINKRLPNLLAWLDQSAPDVACLQELKAEDRGFPEAAIRAAGYSVVWRGQRSWNGVAILARGAEPVLTRTELPGDPNDAQSRYIEAAVRGILVTSIYLPNGNPQPGPKFDYKLAWFERLINHAAELQKSGVPVVLAGDYNVVPTPADIYRSKSWSKNALVQPEPRAAYARLLDQGWTDALRTLHPDEPIYTFWDYKFGRWQRDSGLRIDHLLLSKSLAPRLVAAGVDKHVRGEENASDHAPAWIVLE